MCVTRALVLWISCAAMTAAQSFTIDGQWQAQIRSPFSLAVEPNYHIYVWYPSSDKVLLTRQQHRCGVAAPPGRHTVTLESYRLTIVDGEIKTEPATFSLTFVVPHSGGGDDDDDDDDNNPTLRAELKQVTIDAMRKLNDPTTAARLATDYTEWLKRADTSRTAVELDKEIDTIRGDILLTRGNNKDWLKLWRRPVNEVYRRHRVSTGAAYVSGIAGIIEGLNP